MDLYDNKIIGIYCQAFDRWLLITEHDFWIALETAKVLSSKIATTVYIMPKSELTNDNCMDYMLINKTTEKRGMAADLISSQIPTLKVLNNSNNIMFAGLPEDYKHPAGKFALAKLKEYANFVHKYVTAAQLCNVLVNHQDNKTFSRDYLPKEWYDSVTSYGDRTKIDDGVLNEVKRILYFSNDIKEARVNITNILQKEYKKIDWIVDSFYEMIGEKHYFDKDDTNES